MEEGARRFTDTVRAAWPLRRRARERDLVPRPPVGQLALITALDSVAESISSARTVQDVLTIIVESAKRFTGTEKVVVCLVDEFADGLAMDETTMVVRGARSTHAQEWWGEHLTEIAEDVSNINLRSLTMEETLPPGLSLVPGSVSPAPADIVTGALQTTLKWQFNFPARQETVAYSVRPSAITSYVLATTKVEFRDSEDRMGSLVVPTKPLTVTGPCFVPTNTPTPIASTGITVTVTSGDPGTVTVLNRDEYPGGSFSANELQVVWTLTASASPFTADLEFCVPDDVTGITLRAWRWNESTFAWEDQGGSHSGQCVTVSGVSGFSPWTLASDVPTAITLTDFTAQSARSNLAVALSIVLLTGVILLLYRRRRAIDL